MAQEVIHNFKKIKRKKGYLGMKLDFQKAYEEMEWKILVVVPKAFGFSDTFVQLIQQCISTTQCPPS